MDDCSGWWVRNQIWRRVRRPMVDRLSMMRPQSNALTDLSVNIEVTIAAISDSIAIAVNRNARKELGDG